jgi:hypothetical protein
MTEDPGQVPSHTPGAATDLQDGHRLGVAVAGDAFEVVDDRVFGRGAPGKVELFLRIRGEIASHVVISVLSCALIPFSTHPFADGLRFQAPSIVIDPGEDLKEKEQQEKVSPKGYLETT